jgi:hypothetical protein
VSIGEAERTVRCASPFQITKEDGEEIERARETEMEMTRENKMARKTETVREMYMEMVETEIAKGKYRDDVPCANRRRGKFGAPLISDYVSRNLR